MPVPLPRSRAVAVVLAFVAALCCLAGRDAMASRGALYTQTNDPNGNAVQQFDRAPDGSLTPAGTFATGGAGLADARRPPGRRRAQRRRPLPVRGQRRLRTASRSSASGRDGLGSSTIVLRRRRARQRRRAPRPRLRPQLGRHAERDRVLAPARRLAEADRHARPRAGRARRRPGVGDARRPLAGRQRAGLQPARDAAARPARPPRRAGGDRLERRRAVRLRHRRRARSSSPRRARAPSRPTGSAAAAHCGTVDRVAAPSARALPAGSPSRRTAASPTPATPPAASAASRSRRDGSLTPLGTTTCVPSPRDLDFDESGRYLHAVSPGGQVTVVPGREQRVADPGRHRAGRRRHHRRRRAVTDRAVMRPTSHDRLLRPACRLHQLHAQALPDVSNTQGLADRSIAIMEANGVTVEQFRAIDHEIATGVWPDMTEYGWDRDEWPAIFERVIGADILVLSTPIWLGEKSSSLHAGDRAPVRQQSPAQRERPVRVLRPHRPAAGRPATRTASSTAR